MGTFRPFGWSAPGCRANGSSGHACSVQIRQTCKIPPLQTFFRQLVRNADRPGESTPRAKPTRDLGGNCSRELWFDPLCEKNRKTRLKRISIYKRERLIEIMDKQNQVTNRTFSIILQYGIWITSI